MDVLIWAFLYLYVGLMFACLTEEEPRILKVFIWPVVFLLAMIFCFIDLNEHKKERKRK